MEKNRVDNDILSSSYIKDNSHPFYHSVDVLKCTGSTNEDVKKSAHLFDEGYVLISDMQKCGKGRNEKSFYCEEGKGVYLSILLKPSIEIHESLLITACASVAIVEAINEVYKVSSQIKWVNDIYIKDKKIAGILCESSLNANSSNPEYLIMGIGINIYSMDMPKDIKKIAASIEDFTLIRKTRNELIICFLNRFYKYYSNLSHREYIPYYRNYSNVLHENIMVYENGLTYRAKAIDIDENACLHVEKENKEKHTLSSAEISITK